MQPPLLARLRWWLGDQREALLIRFEDIRDAPDGKALIGGLLVLAVLALGGFVAARALASGSTTSPSVTRQTLRAITIREQVRVRVHGRVQTRWRTRKVLAKPQKVMETQTIHTPSGLRVVTHPVTRYRIVYRKHLVKGKGKTRTVRQPITSTQILTRPVTDTRVVTRTQPVTIIATQTVVSSTTLVSTETDTVTTTVTTSRGH